MKRRVFSRFCFSLDEESDKQLDMLVMRLVEAGFYRANRSAAIRMAIRRLAEDKGWKPPITY